MPGPEYLGWWAAAALLVSILLHVALFFALDYFKITLSFSEARELATAPLNVEQVEVIPQVEDHLPPEETVVPPPDSAALLEEIDLLAKLPKDEEIDIKPDVLAPEYALKMTQPAREGEPDAILPDRFAGTEVDSDLPDLGTMEKSLPPAAVGQITVDPGAVPMEDEKLDKFTADLIRKGARGKVREGALDGITTLDDLIELPANLLISKKTLLPSDLLFEFNSAELRESAKVGLMKLGLLIDRNPNLYCWVEGHTDLIGTPEANLELSRRRAAAVREYLVKSMRMNGDKINPLGKGEFEPLVATGTADDQAPNRRVEIRMRKEPPPAEPEHVIPRAQPAPEANPKPAVTPPAPAKPARRATPPPSATPPPRATPIKPPRALPVTEEPGEPVPPKAEPVEDLPERPAPPKAEPVDPDELTESPRPAMIPRAEAVDE